MNRIQSKIGTYEINRILFDGEIYIQNNGCDGFALGSSKKYKVILITI